MLMNKRPRAAREGYMKTVIVGGVAGGASCAARLRRNDENAEIVLFERGPYISFANCGLPYHVGDVIKKEESLLLQTPEAMKKKFNVDVSVETEVTAIDRDRKVVTVLDKKSGQSREESYDKLVISTGSSPLRPPIPGIESEKIRTLWTVPDAVEIKKLVDSGKVKKAAVIGGGFIGLEMAENLKEAGADVTIVEMTDQVMAPMDYEMAQLLHENIEQNGVKLALGDGVKAFEENEKGVGITLNSGKKLDADLVILSIGVRPNGELAKAAGLETNARGGIVTDEHLLTSDKDIYAVGDVIEVEDLVFGDRTMIPLAGPANKQGRIAADNIAGGNETYKGSQGTAVAKVFDMTAASTGANEKTLKKRGLVKGRDYDTVTIVSNSHAGYYPGAVPMALKLLFSADGKKIFGAQIVGADGVDKRIDTIAVTQRLGGGIEDLKELELAYAPPYSSAKDPVNMAGFTAGNLLDGKVVFSEWDEPETNKDVIRVDVREDAEVDAFAIPDSIHIPLGQIRSRMNELDKSKEIIVFCAIGVRAYNAARILMQSGFDNVKVYPGGSRLFRSQRYKELAPPAPVKALPKPEAETIEPAQVIDTEKAPQKEIRLDCSGLQCPGPIMKVFEAMKTMKDGDILQISASDPGFISDIESWCRRTGNTLLSTGKENKEFTARIMKGCGEEICEVPTVEDKEGKTIIVFSGDLDKVLASFIIANGAAAMGRPVTMFFTFWGLTVLRKEQKQNVKKTPVEQMFGDMLPRGAKNLRLSRMDMGGLGTAMMKRIMKDKNVDSLEDLVKKAMANGVKIIACTMSMDVMGIKQEELIDGVELGGVGTYLGDAEESDVNLFI